MSLDFGNDIYGEPLVSKSFLPEDSAETSLRPKTLDDYVGQTKAKENLSVFIQAAKQRTEPLDHVLLIEESEFDLIKHPERGTALFKCGTERYLLPQLLNSRLVSQSRRRSVMRMRYASTSSRVSTNS